MTGFISGSAPSIIEKISTFYSSATPTKQKLGALIQLGRVKTTDLHEDANCFLVLYSLLF